MLKSINSNYDGFYNMFNPYTQYNEAVVGGMTPISAYSLVPWLFRAVKLRGQAVSSVPYALYDVKTKADVSDNPEWQSLMKGMKKRLRKTEEAKTLTGTAYWLLERNIFGYNITPRWVVPVSMNPIGDEIQGLKYFMRSMGHPGPVQLEDVVYFFNDNYYSDWMPGQGEASVALGAASMLYALDSFAANFFNQGAVKVTVFPVPTSTEDNQIAGLQNFLKRRLMGVRNAFKMMVMRMEEQLKPIVIGSDIKDTEAHELTLDQRDNVAAALGVPPSVIDGKSANYATADSEMTGFYVNTVFPECDELAETANQQLFNPMGLEFRFHPERHEISQAINLGQADTVMSLETLLEEDERRELLGYEPRLKRVKTTASQMVTCPNCQSANQVGAANCVSCGAPLGSATSALAMGAQDDTVKAGDAPSITHIETLAKRMTEMNVQRCEHNNVNRCRICGIERVRDFTVAADGSPVWGVAWKPIAAEFTEAPKRIRMDKPSGANAESGDVISGLTRWREDALKAVRVGGSLDVPVSASVPIDLMRTIDPKLKACRGANDVRRVFDQHWPKESKPVDADLLRELRQELAAARAELKEVE